MSVNTIVFALVALAVAVSGTPWRYRGVDGIPGGELGATECRKATLEVWHLPYPGDCTKFIKCDLIGNLSTIYTCDEPLHFNTKIQTCDWPKSAGCEGGGSSSSSSAPPPEPTPTPSSPPPPEPTPPPPPKPSPTPSSTTTTTAGSCGPSTESPSSESKSCDEKSSSSDDSSSSSDDSSSSSSDDSSSSSSDDSSSSSSGSSEGSCENGGSSSGGGSSGGDSICKDATAHRYHLPHPTDPTKFYKCDLNTGKAHLFDCPSGLVFHADIQVCARPKAFIQW